MRTHSIFKFNAELIEDEWVCGTKCFKINTGIDFNGWQWVLEGFMGGRERDLCIKD